MFTASLNLNLVWSGFKFGKINQTELDSDTS